MKMPSPFIEKTTGINVIIETPKQSCNKYVYDPATGLFRLKKMLPQGMVFPFPFGFIPNTKGEDGDPLDVLILMDEPTYPGCLIEGYIIGALRAEQTYKGNSIRNDRIIVRTLVHSSYSYIDSFADMDKKLLQELSSFFKNYNEAAGKEFKITGDITASKTITLIKNSIQ